MTTARLNCRFHEAAADAQQVIKLKPRWVKGYSRLGAALFGAELYAEAREAYAQALEVEPEDKALQAALQKARMFETRQVAEGAHKFKRKLGGASAAAGGGGGGPATKRPTPAPAVKAAGVKNTALLSFEEAADV
jgi:tetratricopeptide (TPR) repeat protein